MQTLYLSFARDVMFAATKQSRSTMTLFGDRWFVNRELKLAL